MQDYLSHGYGAALAVICRARITQLIQVKVVLQ